MSQLSDSDELDRLAESFVDRLRRGEHPSLTEYTERHAGLADEIRELFPALAEIEGLKPPGDPASNSRLTLPLPDHLGDYRVLRMIGRGGMGVVYEAERQSLQAHVALKVLHPRFRDDPAFRKRFRNEARSAARLHHSHIVPVFDFGEHDGTLYYVMQYIPGRSLDQILDEARQLRDAAPTSPGTETSSPDETTAPYPGMTPPGGSPPPGFVPTVSTTGQTRCLGGSADQTEVARVGAEVAEALAYAHALGVLHRDIKPSNLLIDGRGTAWITDFGLAKFEGGDDLTETGDLIGTLRYLAPERFEARADARSDVYALGVTLYEMLALRPAFDGSDRPRLIRQVVESAPAPLRKRDPRISRDLETIVHKAMARDPSARFASAADLAAELRLVVAGQPIRSRPTSIPEQFGRWCARNPAVAGLVGLASALLILTVVVLTVSAIRLDRSNREVTEHLRVATESESRRVEHLWEASLAEAKARRLSRQPGRRFEALAAVGRAVDISRERGHPPGRIDALRTEAIAALAQPDFTVARRFASGLDVSTMDVDDAFELYAYTDRRGRAEVRRISDESVVATLPADAPGRTVAFGTGRWLLDLSAAGLFRVWDLSGTEFARPVLEETAAVSSDMRPDGRTLAVARKDGSIAIYELPSGRRLEELPRGAVLSQPRLSLHPSEPILVVSSYYVNVMEVRRLGTGRTDTLRLPWPPDGGWEGAYRACWSSDGTGMAIPRGDGEAIALYDFDPARGDLRLARTIREPRILPGLRTEFGPGDDRIVGRGWGNDLQIIDLKNGRIVDQTLPFTSALDWPIRVDRRGGRLFAGGYLDESEGFGYWSVGWGLECRLVAAPPGTSLVRGLDCTADGRFAVLARLGGTIEVFDLDRELAVGRVNLPGVTGYGHVSLDGAGHLLTNTEVGCFRWPIRPSTAKASALTIGPPERLRLYPGHIVCASSRDGSVVAQAMTYGYGMQPYAGGWIVRPGSGGPPIRVVSNGQDIAAVSPDGRWAAFSVFGVSSVHDTTTGKVAWTNAETASGVARFTPCGRWLAISGRECRLFAVGTWQPGPSLGPGVLTDISADGTMALLCLASRAVRLVRVPSGREVARFEDPEPSEAASTSYVFTRDGARLVGWHSRGLRVWDLRRIREGLIPLGLDWDAPAYSPPTPAPDPVSIRFFGEALVEPTVAAFVDGLLGLTRTTFQGRRATAIDRVARGRALARLGMDGLAVRDFDEALRREPGMPEALEGRGLLAFGRHDWPAAEADFRQAIERGPSLPTILFRLAWTHHELGRDDLAALDLNAWRKVDSGEPPHASSILTLLAGFREATGEHDRAESARKAAGASLPDLPGSLATDARRLLLAPRYRRADGMALALAQAARGLAPDRRDVLEVLALALFQTGDRAGAVALVARGHLDEGPADASAWGLTIAAMARHGLGQTSEAQSLFNRAAALREQTGTMAPDRADELARLETEARMVLGLPR